LKAGIKPVGEGAKEGEKESYRVYMEYMERMFGESFPLSMTLDESGTFIGTFLEFEKYNGVYTGTYKEVTKENVWVPFYGDREDFDVSIKDVIGCSGLINGRDELVFSFAKFFRIADDPDNEFSNGIQFTLNYTRPPVESKRDENGFVTSSDGTLLLSYEGNASEVVIPDGVTCVFPNAFYGCESRSINNKNGKGDFYGKKQEVRSYISSDGDCINYGRACTAVRRFGRIFLFGRVCLLHDFKQFISSCYVRSACDEYRTRFPEMGNPP